ncbi:hypothetical protein FC34_GL000744 [Lacticaseibacillus brantae DSM 23927]|uniref:DUF3310 domain-containing protein n=2 Tax=Lacticaseibacillus brantae TaxID=943673 RepID=A0A0R2B1B5_9LACO|nr:hypothetical protein FC34_GL000744 [Lacticaseibacillus brantae DSM 23927]
METIDVIKASMQGDEFRGFLKGNIFKYISRYRKKNGVEDLHKAQWYVEKLTEYEMDQQDAAIYTGNGDGGN